MSQGNFLERLLGGVEVEWKALGDIAQILNGFAFESSKYSDNGIRVIRISDVQKGRMSDKDLKFYPVETEEEIKRYLLKENDLVMSLTGNVGRVAMLSKSDLPAGLNQRVACIRTNKTTILIRYLFHFFDQVSFENEAMNNATGGGQKNMSTRWLSSYQIPIPCPDNPKKSLAIQAEIVRILDTFTELTAELTARKKQYAYYRDQLLRFEDGEVEWRTIGELFDLRNGYTPSKANTDYWNNGEVSWFRMEDIRENGRILRDSIQKVSLGAVKGKKLFPANSIIISTSATIGEYALITTPYLANQRFTCLSLKSAYADKFEIKFIFYYCSVLADWCKKNTTVSSFASVDMEGFRKLKIPIPPLAEQARIVAILDQFDALTNSLTEGLPREIELRQKQYAYYRDLLFSFPKPASSEG
jgi:type I restriction enzyme S subunit